MFGQVLLSIIILLFIVGSISILMSIFTENISTFSPAKIKSNNNTTMNKPPSGVLGDLDINNVFDSNISGDDSVLA